MYRAGKSLDLFDVEHGVTLQEADVARDVAADRLHRLFP
jgi:hypothetical protein